MGEGRNGVRKYPHLSLFFAGLWKGLRGNKSRMKMMICLPVFSLFVRKSGINDLSFFLAAQERMERAKTGFKVAAVGDRPVLA